MSRYTVRRLTSSASASCAPRTGVRRRRSWSSSCSRRVARTLMRRLRRGIGSITATRCHAASRRSSGALHWTPAPAGNDQGEFREQHPDRSVVRPVVRRTPAADLAAARRRPGPDRRRGQRGVAAAAGRAGPQRQPAAGAQALFGALQNDFSGGPDLGGLLGAVLGGTQSRQTNGAGILGHVLGGQQPRAEAALGQATGLGGDKAGQLLKILAPIVLAFLARQMFQGQGAAAGASPSAGLLGSIL